VQCEQCYTTQPDVSEKRPCLFIRVISEIRGKNRFIVHHFRYFRIFRGKKSFIILATYLGRTKIITNRMLVGFADIEHWAWKLFLVRRIGKMLGLHTDA